MDDIHKNNEVYNTNKKRKLLIELNDMLSKKT